MKARGDGIDLEALDHLISQSSAYRRVVDRIEEARMRAFQDLKIADSWERVVRLQERIAAFELVMCLPKILADEIRDSAAAAAKGKPSR